MREAGGEGVGGERLGAVHLPEQVERREALRRAGQQVRLLQQHDEHRAQTEVVGLAEVVVEGGGQALEGAAAARLLRDDAQQARELLRGQAHPARGAPRASTTRPGATRSASAAAAAAGAGASWPAPRHRPRRFPGPPLLRGGKKTATRRARPTAGHQPRLPVLFPGWRGPGTGSIRPAAVKRALARQRRKQNPPGSQPPAEESVARTQSEAAGAWPGRGSRDAEWAGERPEMGAGRVGGAAEVSRCHSPTLWCSPLMGEQRARPEAPRGSYQALKVPRNLGDVIVWKNASYNLKSWGFPGGTVVKSLPAKVGDTGSSPGPGRSRMPRSN